MARMYPDLIERSGKASKSEKRVSKFLREAARAYRDYRVARGDVDNGRRDFHPQRGTGADPGKR